MLKSSGPKILPWGTPLATLIIIFFSSSYFIYPRIFRVALTANVSEHFNNTRIEQTTTPGTSCPTLRRSDDAVPIVKT